MSVCFPSQVCYTHVVLSLIMHDTLHEAAKILGHIFSLIIQGRVQVMGQDFHVVCSVHTSDFSLYTTHYSAHYLQCTFMQCVVV